MEHEVFVPVPAETLRQTLADPARVARCVPGLQQDADASAGPLAGRLKVRVGGHTITYRGALRITGQDDGFAVEGEGTEARGSGSAKLALTLRLTPAEGGTTLTFTGTAHADGRLAEADAATVAQAGTRLLDRFASSLASKATDQGPGPARPSEARPGASHVADAPQDPARPDDSTEPGPSGGRPEDAGATRASTEAQAGPGKTDAGATPGGEPEGPSGAGSTDDAVTRPSGDDDGTPAADAEPGPAENGAGETQRADAADAPGADASVYDVEVPPSALDPLADEAFGDDEEPPAEAAHARRTMIGRSAEEVDHAPPRGRYAPVPAPQTGTAGNTLRWVAPAAALALASAVVVGRALRRRK
ncbi:SRPBCC family protein [Streptomyces sp. NPDC091376]|uniref:SRPBCC family protein n=1 Tax=Streptomyces sp. NPDC091376 TaxID=3365994 RepID=UPI0038225634